jgi:hypothetical protein
MALATLNDLAALGAITFDADPTTVVSRRATWLLDRASEQVCAYLGTTEALIAADAVTWTAVKVGVLRAVATEAAASRLQGSAVSPTEGSYPEAYMSALLQPRHYRTLDKLIGSTNDFTSVVVERDESSSFFRPYDPFADFSGSPG